VSSEGKTINFIYLFSEILNRNGIFLVKKINNNYHFFKIIRMRKPEIIHYKGKDVVYIDLSNLKSNDEIIQLEKQASEMIRSRPVKSVYTLTNMEGMFFNNDIKSFFEDAVKHNAPFVCCGAVIGLSGLITIFYNAFLKITGRNIKSFRTKEEALEYLAMS